MQSKKKKTKKKPVSSTYNASDTKYMCFPYLAILQFSVDTNWVSYNLIQFWHHLELVQTLQVTHTSARLAVNHGFPRPLQIQ